MSASPLTSSRPSDGLLLAFTRDQRREGVLESSITRRASDLRAFARWLDPESILDATKDDVNAFLDLRRGRGGAPHSPRSRYLWLSNLHAFYGWAIDEEITMHDPTARIRRPKLRPGLPRPVQTADLVRAIEGAEPVMRAWLALAAFAGLRCAEIAGVHRDDIREDSMMLRVMGKGQKERLVPLHPFVLAAIKDAGWRRRGPIFRRPSGAEYSPAQVSRLIALHCDELEIEATAHQFRHWFGTTAFEACGDIRTVADLLGHANMNTSLTYAAFSPTRARAAVAAMQLPVMTLAAIPTHPRLPFEN